MVGTRPLTVGAAPVVMAPSLSSQTKILPVTYQLEPTVCVSVAVVFPSSSRPATRMVKVC